MIGLISALALLSYVKIVPRHAMPVAWALNVSQFRGYEQNCLNQPMKSCLRGPRPPRTSCFRPNALIFRNGTKADSAVARYVFKPLQSILWSLLMKLQFLLPPSHKTKAFSLFFFFFQILNEMVESLQDVQGISRVLYDLTAKPPGTTEWE